MLLTRVGHKFNECAQHVAMRALNCAVVRYQQTEEIDTWFAATVVAQAGFNESDHGVHERRIGLVFSLDGELGVSFFFRAVHVRIGRDFRSRVASRDEVRERGAEFPAADEVLPLSSLDTGPSRANR